MAHTQTQEIRTVSSTGAAKGVKPEAFDLIPPNPMRLLAKFYAVAGASPLASDNWSDAFNYVSEQLWLFWADDDTDPDTGLPRLVSAAAGCFELYERLTEARGRDDRPASGAPTNPKDYTGLVPVTELSDTQPAPRYDLIPYAPLAALARHYSAGASKYAAHNWAAGYEWSKPFAALMRHLLAFWNGEDYDEETGSPHITAAAWHCLTMVEFYDTHPEFDDRPVRGMKETKMSLAVSEKDDDA